MASTEKITRIIHLIDVLQTRRELNADELARAVNTSRRTIFRDIKVLRASGINIDYNEAKQGYSLARSAFLPSMDLTVEETLALILMCESAAPQKWPGQIYAAIESASLKMHGNLPGQIQEEVGELTNAIVNSTDGTLPAIRNAEHHERLMDSIRQRRRVRITYDSLSENGEIKTLLSPYRLFFHKRSWYVIGRSSLHRAVRTFHIGRIQESTLTEVESKVPPRFSLERFFGKAWRMIRRPGPASKVRIRFQPLVARNVADVIWHRTQQINWNADGSLDFRVTVEGLDELSWWVLGYGDQAEVLEPTELRDLIRDRIQKMHKIYKPTRGSPAAVPRTASTTKSGRRAKSR